MKYLVLTTAFVVLSITVDAQPSTTAPKSSQASSVPSVKINSEQLPNATRSGIPIVYTKPSKMVLDTASTSTDQWVAYAHEVRFNERKLYANVLYPEAAMKQGLEGSVVMHVLIDSSGTPTRIKIEEYAHEMLVGAAVDAVNKVEYQPAVLNEKPVSAWTRIVVNFKLNR